MAREFSQFIKKFLIEIVSKNIELHVGFNDKNLAAGYGSSSIGFR